MHAPDRPASTPAPARGRAGEHAWGVVELMVAMVIMLTLVGIAIVSFGSARGAVTSKEAITAGAAYNDAIAKFQADHANKLPTAADMLSPTTGSAARGPRNLLDSNKSYMAAMPDGVIAGRVAVKMTPNSSDCATTDTGNPATPVGTATSLVSYCPATEPNYGIRVRYKVKKNDTWAQARICWLGRTPNAPRC